MRVLVIGATGHFGGRICRRLLGHPGIELVVASRSIDAAGALAQALEKGMPGVQVAAVAVDQHSKMFRADLAALHVDAVAHTAGPYQGQDYTVAKACIAAGCHYLDLADGRDFVDGFHQLNEKAADGGVLLVSGASTLPGVSSAVVSEVRTRFGELHSINTSIAPAHRTPRGTGTVAAVLSYCGKPFDVLTNGAWLRRFGWQDLRMHRYPNIGVRWGGACDVPDLALMPKFVQGLRTATFHAALEAKWEQLVLWAMAGLTRIGVVRSWSRAVPLCRKLSDKLIGLGTDRGGMQMRIGGLDHNGQALEIHWNLTALQNHGPEIPCVPLLILIRKLAAGELHERGARPCLGMVTLNEFDTEVSDLDIEWQFTEHRERIHTCAGAKQRR